MDKIALLPCPFCGGAAQTIGHTTRCDVCSAEVYGAPEEWNRRTPVLTGRLRDEVAANALARMETVAEILSEATTTNPQADTDGDAGA